MGTPFLKSLGRGPGLRRQSGLRIAVPTEAAVVPEEPA
jgi:hypothetical protein